MSVIHLSPWHVTCPNCGATFHIPEDTKVESGGSVCDTCGKPFSFREFTGNRFKTDRVDP